jgi:hypothetical protein
LVEDRDCETAMVVGNAPLPKHRRQFLAVLDRFIVIREAQFKPVKGANGVCDIEIVRLQRHHPTEPSKVIAGDWFPAARLCRARNRLDDGLRRNLADIGQ